jgi:EPS-associated MarR family transcriptional regulator
MRDKETVVKLLNILFKNPEYSQRDIASALGISLGKVNYVLRALIDKGLIKTERFINSRNKWAYRYLLTPRGIKEKLRLTRDFVKRKIKEYESLLD